MIDLKLLAAILNEKETELLFNEDLANALVNDAKPAFLFVRDFYKKYGELPSFEILTEKTKINIADWTDSKTPAYYADLIRDRAIRTTIRKASSVIQTKLEKENITGDKALELMEKALVDARIAPPEENHLVDITKQEQRNKRYQLFLEKEGNKDFVNGIASPWRILDEMSCGWQPSDLITVVGTTSVGKTFFLLLLANAASVQGKRVLFGSLEMGIDPLSIRLDAIHNQISHHDLKRGQLTHFEREKYIQFLQSEDTACGPVLIANPNAVKSISELEVAIEKTKPDIVFVDSFYKMKVLNAPKALWEKVSHIVWELKTLAGRRNVPVIISGQFGRQIRGGPTNRSNRRGEMQDVSFAYTLSQDSDVMLSLSQNMDLAERGLMHLSVLKMRNDEVGSFYLTWDLDIMRFDVVDFAEVQAEEEDEDHD